MSFVRDLSKELYRFVDGASGAVYTVTSSDTAEVYNFETYEPVTIGRDEVQGKGEMSRQNLTISFSLDNATARQWFVSSLDFPLTVTIYSKEGDDIEVEWKGRLASVAPKKTQIDFTFESVFTSMRRMGLRQRYQITCPHALYGKGCNLNKEAFAVTGGVSLVENVTVTVPEAASYADGYFTSGMFEDNAGNLRFVTKHVGSVITLIRPMNALIDYVAENGYTGVSCRLFPGCDRSKEICQSRFDNLLNHGGFPFMPTVNPFGGSSIV